MKEYEIDFEPVNGVEPGKTYSIDIEGLGVLEAKIEKISFRGHKYATNKALLETTEGIVQESSIEILHLVTETGKSLSLSVYGLDVHYEERVRIVTEEISYDEATQIIKDHYAKSGKAVSFVDFGSDAVAVIYKD